MEEKYLSTGIDIGTTTTHLIISSLTIAVKGGFGVVPRVEILDKEILYKSKIYFTPLHSDGRISAEGVREILDKEYEKAKISPEDLKNGAVIITGESARKRNAKEVLYEISHYAGDFVLAEAGGERESILAGKGANAQKLSLDESKTVANIDIGGGTTNTAVFSCGELIAASCIDVGGRLVQVKENDGKIIVAAVSDKISDDIDLKIGEELTVEKEKDVCNILIDRLKAELKRLPKAEVYTVSGGVGACMKDAESRYCYGDLGVVLAEEIKKHFKNFTVTENPIRATVIGAGNYSFEISGSTIFYSNIKFPMRNIPCVKVKLTSEADIERAFVNLTDTIAYFDLKKPVAVAFNAWKGISAQAVMKIAKNLSSKVQPLISANQPVIVLVQEDVGKAFGLCLKSFLPDNYPLLCIDSVAAGDQDFIDIGNPVGEGRAVPVSIKQLLFSV